MLSETQLLAQILSALVEDSEGLSPTQLLTRLRDALADLPPGGGGGGSYLDTFIYTQVAPSASWTITVPGDRLIIDVAVLDTDGQMMLTDTVVEVNVAYLTFPTPLSGKAQITHIGN